MGESTNFSPSFDHGRLLARKRAITPGTRRFLRISTPLSKSFRLLCESELRDARSLREAQIKRNDNA